MMTLRERAAFHVPCQLSDVMKTERPHSESGVIHINQLGVTGNDYYLLLWLHLPAHRF